MTAATASYDTVTPASISPPTDHTVLVNNSVYTQQGYDQCMFYLQAPGTDIHSDTQTSDAESQYSIQLTFDRLFGFAGKVKTTDGGLPGQPEVKDTPESLLEGAYGQNGSINKSDSSSRPTNASSPPNSSPQCLPRIEIVEVTLPYSSIQAPSEGTAPPSQHLMHTICHPDDIHTPNVFQSDSHLVRLIFTWPRGDSNTGFQLTYTFQKKQGVYLKLSRNAGK